jgi:hypothetical protein
VKKRDFLDLVVKKMCTISVVKRDSFIGEYLSHFAVSSNFKIDACIAIVKSDVHVLIERLIDHLEQNDKRSLDESSRHLLGNVDLTACFCKKSEVHTKLFTILGNLPDVTREDHQLFVNLIKQNTRKQEEIVPVVISLVPVFKHGSFADYLSPDKSLESFLNVFDKLAARNDLKNLYSFIDGLWCRLDNVQCPSLQLIYIVQKIIDIKNQNGWNNINKHYVLNVKIDDYTMHFLDVVKKCDRLFDNSKDDCGTVIFEYSSAADFAREIFCRNNIFKFKFPGQRFQGQEFVLSTTAIML